MSSTLLNARLFISLTASAFTGRFSNRVAITYTLSHNNRHRPIGVDRRRGQSGKKIFSSVCLEKKLFARSSTFSLDRLGTEKSGRMPEIVSLRRTIDGRSSDGAKNALKLSALRFNGSSNGELLFFPLIVIIYIYIYIYSPTCYNIMSRNARKLLLLVSYG